MVFSVVSFVVVVRVGPLPTKDIKQYLG